MISIREHCIPAYDNLRRMERVSPMPKYLSEMEEGTAGGIIAKLKAVIESEYFNDLPDQSIIKSGMVDNWQWVKKDVLYECKEIIKCIPRHV